MSCFVEWLPPLKCFDLGLVRIAHVPMNGGFRSWPYDAIRRESMYLDHEECSSVKAEERTPRGRMRLT
jgi:hypothetical protein